MGSAAAVSVNDDLSAGKSRVALRAADNKSAGGVYIIFCILVQKLGGDARLYDKLNHIAAYLLKAHLGRVLGREDDGVDANGSARFVILDGDLSFAVGAQIIYQSLLSHVGKAFCKLV